MKKIEIIYFVFALSVILLGCRQAETQDNEGLTDSSLLDIKEKGTLIVGTDAPYGKMEFFDESGEIVGIDIDVTKKIADEIGVQLVVRDYEWDALFDAVKSGEIDIAVSSITVTPERSEEMLFSVPYFNGGQVIIVREENKEIRIKEGLKDMKIGVQTDTTGQYEAEKFSGSVTAYDSYEIPEENPRSGMIYDLTAGHLDAIILDYVAGIDVINLEPGLMIVGEPFTQEFYGIATKKDNLALISEINQVLGTMIWAGEIREISNKWTT
ncbi:MAG: ABC transporter substrate-binding protein [Nanoarchaeota archaeon]|nr:ABC transporter substrate-binding protein [Nanoarchaeota archaeon]